MIAKFKTIKNLAVFKDFNWDREVRDKGNNVVTLKRINILYGRNYSGKTTLSRVVRAMETGQISSKYENPECCICIDRNPDVTQVDFKAHSKTFRVFNEDFIEDNLKFIINHDENIEPFAILGGDNAKIEEDIRALTEQLGSDEVGNESGLFHSLKSIETIYQTAKRNLTTNYSNLDNQLSNKATGRPNGIKYQSDKYGDQNYNISKLKVEIEEIRKNTYVPITDAEKKQTERLLTEQIKNPISELPDLVLNLSSLITKAKEVVHREVGKADKIQLLLKEAVLNRWVKEGKDLHQSKLNTCAFCNNKISENRWIELDKHFDEESDKLENDIDNILYEIKSERELISSTNGLRKNEFYYKFHRDVDTLAVEYTGVVDNYHSSLKKIEKQLEERKKDLLNIKGFEDVKDYTSELIAIKARFNEIREQSNEYSKRLDSEQTNAKKKLRLCEIYDFIHDIRYDDQISNIASLQQVEEFQRTERDNKQREIDDVLDEISVKQRELKDESKGADKVNEYLNDYFGHNFLTLKAVEFENEGAKKFRFEIHREHKKAYHLSEGEKSLIAFCYFVAKLQDVDTKSKQPIIWIDDPISSLDSNHIFFIYTLINTQVFVKNDFEQLFISTHNLNFLKYLKRLPDSRNTCYLIVERNDSISTISEMPKYMQKYVTEFNYLFKQIFICSKMETVSDENYTVFYNFGNNARKFLEIYLYYKYPDLSSESDKMKRFFGDRDIPVVLTERINNEYSHLSGVFERGAAVIEVPEMNKTAKLIIEKIKEDTDQYQALLKSIGVDEDNE